MPTRRTIYWLAAAAALYLIALNVGSGWLYVVTATLLAMPLAAPLLSRLNCRRLEVVQSCSGSAVDGDTLSSQLLVTNPHRLPRFFLRLDLKLGGGGASALIPYLGPLRSCPLTLPLAGLKRGVYPGGSVIVSSSAPAGLARGRQRHDTVCRLVVYPRWRRLTGEWNAGQSGPGANASSASAARSASSDYLGVRDYRPEDSPRAIHWPTSARTGSLAVIEFSRQAATSPVFILDRYGGAGGFDSAMFETAVTVAASLVQRESLASRRFAIGATPLEAVESALTHDAAAMLWLAAVQPDAEAPLDLDGASLPWPEATPVLILPSSRRYRHITESGLLMAFPHSSIIMLDGRRFTGDLRRQADFMDSRELERLLARMAAGPGGLAVAGSEEEALACLEDL